MAQHYESPEAALSEHMAAYKARDLARFLASIDFEYEARAELKKRAEHKSDPTEAEVSAAAASLREALKEHFEKFGFRAATYDNCRVVTKFQDSETQARIVLSCSDSHGSTTFPVRVVRLAVGWRVVRGG